MGLKWLVVVGFWCVWWYSFKCNLLWFNGLCGSRWLEWRDLSLECCWWLVSWSVGCEFVSISDKVCLSEVICCWKRCGFGFVGKCFDCSLIDFLRI